MGPPNAAIVTPDPLGVAWQSRTEPVTANYERSLCHLLVHADDSSIESTFGGATALIEDANRGGSQVVLLGRSILLMTRQFLRLVKALSEQWGYAGEWRVGVHAAPLLGSVWQENAAWGQETPFARDSFTVDQVGTPVTWSDSAEEETVRLLAGLLRGAGQTGWSFGQLLGRRY